MLGCNAGPGNVRWLSVPGKLARELEGGLTVPSIVGTWKLVAAVARDRSGNPLPAPYGGKGMGRLTLNADGRMMAGTLDGPPGLPAGKRPGLRTPCRDFKFDRGALVTPGGAA